MQYPFEWNNLRAKTKVVSLSVVNKAAFFEQSRYALRTPAAKALIRSVTFCSKLKRTCYAHWALYSGKGQLWNCVH